MANIKSAKKRVLVNKRQKKENKFVRSTLSTEIKKFRKEVEDGNFEQAEQMLKHVESEIMSSKSKGVLHDNTASRKVSRLKALLDNAKRCNVKTEEKPAKAKKEAAKPVEEAVKVEAVEEVKPAKKVATKKTTTKETAAKEPKASKEPKTTKKETTKKETVKKETTKKEPAKKETKTTTAKKTTTKKA